MSNFLSCDPAAPKTTATQVETKLTGSGTVTDLLRAPLGNHLVLVVGHHRNRLQSWCKGAT